MTLRQYLRSPFFWVAFCYGLVLFLFKAKYDDDPLSEIAIEAGGSSLALIIGFYLLFRKRKP